MVHSPREWKNALWAELFRLSQQRWLEKPAEGRFSMGAPARQRRSVERYNIVKRA